MKQITRRSILAAAPATLALAVVPARAAKNYGPGVTDTEIKIGNTGPYSGPASSYGTIAKSEAAYFRLVNDQGGVNGRKINFISYDDAYSPPKTVEQVRKLVEEDNVLLVMSPLGTPTNSAIWHYMNQKKVPQLFVATGATKWNDPKHYPWTMLVGSPITRARGIPTPLIFCKTSPTARSRCSTRTTISARII
jgi:branched-chain amino acid transport system substrate-binding protein